MSNPCLNLLRTAHLSRSIIMRHELSAGVSRDASLTGQGAGPPVPPHDRFCGFRDVRSWSASDNENQMILLAPVVLLAQAALPQEHAIYKSVDHGATWIRAGSNFPGNPRINSFGKTTDRILTAKSPGVSEREWSVSASILGRSRDLYCENQCSRRSRRCSRIDN